MEEKNILLYFLSTNYNKYIPSEIIKNIYKSNLTNNKLIYNNNDNSIKCNIIMNETSNYNKIDKNLLYNDSIITFIDLENYCSFDFLKNVIDIIRSNFSNEKQIYFIGLYKDENKIINNMNETNLKQLFESYNMNNEYMQVNINLSVKLKDIFDEIIEDLFQKQEYYDNYYKIDEMNESNFYSIKTVSDNSYCIIF